MLIEEDMQHDDLIAAVELGIIVTGVAKTTRSDRTIFCKPEVKSH